MGRFASLCTILLLAHDVRRTAGWSTSSLVPFSWRNRHRTCLWVLPVPQQNLLLERNITDGDSWLPALGNTMKSMKELTRKEEGRSLMRAIEHTYAILDLYNETGRGLSEDLVLSTLENVVHYSTAKPEELTGELLEEVEDLVWRLRDFELVPSLRVLEALWEMQQYHTANLAEKASKQVGRQVNLLDHWRRWSNVEEQGGQYQLPLPPISYLVDVLRYAVDQHVSMSFTLWDLFQAVSDDPKIPCERIVYSHVLKILSQSPPSWNVRQRRVCQDMITQSRRKLNEPFWPTPDEIRNALQATVPVGRAQDAAWLVRVLEMCPNGCEDSVSRECRSLFLKAILHADDPGSLLYMEELLFSGKWEDDSIEDWKILLMKCARWNKKGCGSRAEAILQKIELKHQEHWDDAWMPDIETLELVVQAYLNEPERRLSHVLDATRILKRCIGAYDLYRIEQSTKIRLFDTLLAAFDDYVRTDPQAIKAADELFRFFMIQHRDGRVTEEPDRFHLGHILRHHNRQFKKERLQRGAEKSLEYFRLFRTLFRKGKISSPPDLFNVRQLLGTLALTPDPGYGSVAKETLADALAVESPVHPYAYGHMFWCVIKCFCNENRIHEAMAILDQWENEFAALPSSIRLTGAPYQTIIHTLAASSGHNPDIAVDLVSRLENQYQNGNHRVRLRGKLYREALMCCGEDATAQNRIHESFRRMNFTSLEVT